MNPVHFPLQNTFRAKCREISHLGQFSSLFWLVVVVEVVVDWWWWWLELL